MEGFLPEASQTVSHASKKLRYNSILTISQQRPFFYTSRTPDSAPLSSPTFIPHRMTSCTGTAHAHGDRVTLHRP